MGSGSNPHLNKFPNRHLTCRLIGCAVVGVMALTVISQSRAFALFAFTADSIEQKGRLESTQTVLIASPQVINGDYQLHKNELISENLPISQLILGAINLACVSTLSAKGYEVITMEDYQRLSPEGNRLNESQKKAWQEIKKFSDAGQPEKRKMMPKIISESNEFIHDVSQKADAVIFVQFFAQVDSALLTPSQMTANSATTVGVGVAAAALTGGPVFFSPGVNTEYDYKISVVNAKTGELIWFTEGHDNQSDIGSKGRLIESFGSLLNGRIPKCLTPKSRSKFKTKRSEMRKTEEGG